MSESLLRDGKRAKPTFRNGKIPIIFFIRNGTIEECIVWALEYVHMCHPSWKEIIIFKLDFKKAFDKVEHEYMLKVMKANGFPQK